MYTQQFLTSGSAASKVAIIDDDADMRDVLELRLAVLGRNLQIDKIDPLSASNRPDCRVWEDYRLVLLDMNLGIHQQQGLNWLEHIKKTAPNTHVVVITGVGSSSLARAARQAGASDHVLKSELSVVDLAGRLKMILPLSAAQDSDPSAKSAGLQHYDLDELIAKNTFSEVWRGTRKRDNRAVAIKRFEHDDTAEGDALDAFLTEQTILGSLAHPNVVTLLDQGFDDMGGYSVLEYCERGDLAQTLLDHPHGVSISQASQILLATLRGLAAVHDHGVTHGDIKPSNILQRANGSYCITDFDASTRQHHDPASDTGPVHATRQYSAPELAEGAPPSVASDLYAVGAVGAALVTGHPPFGPLDYRALNRAIIEKCIEPADTASAEQLEYLIATLMAASPTDRPDSARAAVRVLIDGATVQLTRAG